MATCTVLRSPRIRSFNDDLYRISSDKSRQERDLLVATEEVFTAKEDRHQISTFSGDLQRRQNSPQMRPFNGEGYSIRQRSPRIQSLSGGVYNISSNSSPRIQTFNGSLYSISSDSGCHE